MYTDCDSIIDPWSNNVKLLIYVLITNYNIINENYLKNYNYIDVLINQKLIRIRINSIYYLDKQLDLSVIEIKENEEVNILELDEDIYREE